MGSLSTWNYRIVATLGGYMLREVFYDEQGRPTKHGSASADRTLFDAPGEILNTLTLMLQACERDVLLLDWME